MRYLIVGLGNIGPEYAGTRHNIGFQMVDVFANSVGAEWEDKRYGFVAHCRVKNAEIVLLKPSTYMNLSGNAVRYWQQKLDLPLDHILIICDDINLPFGTIRLRASGSPGGHNGLENIEQLLGTPAYPRLRIGIGNEYAEGQLVDYVLGELRPEQREQIPELAKKIIAGARTWAFVGIGQAMNQLNTRPKPVSEPQNSVSSDEKS